MGLMGLLMAYYRAYRGSQMSGTIGAKDHILQYSQDNTVCLPYALFRGHVVLKRGLDRAR